VSRAGSGEDTQTVHPRLHHRLSVFVRRLNGGDRLALFIQVYRNEVGDKSTL